MAKPYGLLWYRSRDAGPFLFLRARCRWSALWVSARATNGSWRGRFDDGPARGRPARGRGCAGSSASRLRASATLANGHDTRAVEPDSVDKSIGAEETFDKSITRSGVAQARHWLAAVRADRGATAIPLGLRGRTVSIKVLSPFHHNHPFLRTRRCTDVTRCLPYR